MRIEKKTPQSWKVPALISGGKIVELLSRKPSEPSEKGEAAELEVFVFFAELEYAGLRRSKTTKSVWHAFKCADGDLEVRFSQSTLEDFFFAQADGRVTFSAKSGLYKGLWTFRNFAGAVACGPVTQQEIKQLGL